MQIFEHEIEPGDAEEPILADLAAAEDQVYWKVHRPGGMIDQALAERQSTGPAEVKGEIGNTYGYGILEPSGEPYFDAECCVWGFDDAGRFGAESACDSLNDDRPEYASQYVVVELFWQPVGLDPFAWEPIETAPKDGTDIQLGKAGYSRVAVGCYDPNNCGDLWVTNLRGVTGWTHWMPQPEPPKEPE